MQCYKLVNCYLHNELKERIIFHSDETDYYLMHIEHTPIKEIDHEFTVSCMRVDSKREYIKYFNHRQMLIFCKEIMRAIENYKVYDVKIGE